MKTLTRIAAVLIATALAACSSSSGGSSDSGGGGFAQPAGTVAVNFKVQDQTHLYGNAQMEWKGSYTWDAATRKITFDSGWAGGVGPYPPLYDDGPWNAGGHEPTGSVAGDHVLGITVFVTPPASGTQTYSFGLHDPWYQTTFGNGWIWGLPSPGSFDVAAGATGQIDALASPYVITSGNNDFELVLDAGNLDNSQAWSTSTVQVKGSALAWAPLTVTTTAPNLYTFRMSDFAGAADKPFRHTGLLPSGAKPEFVWVLNGVEYKDASTIAISTGVTAGYRVGTTGAFTPLTISTYNGGGENGNTYVTIP
jgi:hypothetical protein